MIKVSKETTRRLLDIHGWSAILLGLALYIVVFSGSIVVFSHEIGGWSVSGYKTGEALTGKIDYRLNELAETLPKEYLDEVGLWQNSAGEIIAFYHTHVKNEKGHMSEKGVRFVLDPESLEIISQVEGLQEDLPVVRSGFLEEFFVDLHVRLHAPDPLGLYLTGILGLVLLVSAISGFIIHRHLIKDIFLSPRVSSRLLNTRDRHNLAGTWGLLFSVILAFTGAFFSFATTLGLPVIAITAFGGDQQRAMEAILGAPEAEDKTPSTFVGIEKIVKKAQQADIANSKPVFIFIQHMGRADATVLTTHDPNTENIFFTTHTFDGVTGEYHGEKPRVGKIPSTGSNLIGLMGVLHFGWFAGLLSRIIWLSLGMATCYVTLTGLQLWMDRRERGKTWQYLSKFISIIGYGLPIAMFSAGIGFLLSYSGYAPSVEKWTVNGFLIGIVISFIIGFLFSSAERRRKVFQQITGLGAISLPLIRNFTSEHTWGENLAAGNAIVLGLDISLLITGLILLLLSAGIISRTKFSKDELKKTSSQTALEAE